LPRPFFGAFQEKVGRGGHILLQTAGNPVEAIMAEVEPDSQATHALLERIGRGDRTALERLLTRYRPRLHAFVEMHLDPGLLAGGPSPSQQLAARELAERVAGAVAELAEDDREILLLRHAEELSYEEIACLLEIEAATARKRYGRALIRLQRVLAQHGVLEE